MSLHPGQFCKDLSIIYPFIPIILLLSGNVVKISLRPSKDNATGKPSFYSILYAMHVSVTRMSNVHTTELTVTWVTQKCLHRSPESFDGNGS